MAAERKLQETEVQPASTAESGTSEPAVSIADQDAAATSSPARELQEHLHKSISGKTAVSSVHDMGRILAASSGITAILGAFIFSGIW